MTGVRARKNEGMVRDRLRNLRDGFWRRLLKVGFIRRWQARRLIAYIEKSKKKHRRLPEELVRVDAMVRRLPKPQRAKALEEMLVPTSEEQFGRDIRRAAARQNRASGRGGPRRRPGLPPADVSRRQVRRPR